MKKILWGTGLALLAGCFTTTTPLETEMALRRLLPVKYWKTWNSHLVSFGQTRCLPRNPHCEDCPIRNCCSSIQSSRL